MLAVNHNLKQIFPAFADNTISLFCLPTQQNNEAPALFALSVVQECLVRTCPRPTQVIYYTKTTMQVRILSMTGQV